MTKTGQTARSRHRRRHRAPAVAVVGVLLALTAAACSSDSDQSGDTSAPPTEQTTTVTDESGTSVPDGPSATIDGPMTGGNGTFLGAAVDPAPALDDAGYVETEYTATGTASSYTPVGELPADGTFTLEEDASDDYVTRIVVRRPENPEDFNGTVAVEWLNVSGGVDAGPDYTYLQDELLREGYAWVGVSAQSIGIEGGPVLVEAPGAAEAGAGKGLRGIDPERYDGLHHPGDAYAYDIYTQVGRALRSPGDIDPLDGLEAQRLIAVGESQSAFMLTTYYDGVQPLTDAFDGFFIHSRGGSAAPLATPGGDVDVASSIGGEPTALRTDVSTPAIMIQTESDLLGVLGYYPARQPDSDNVRLWEVAGAAHADLFQVGEAQAEAFDCGNLLNNGQQVFVLRSALRHLNEWITDGTPPPNGDPLEVDDSSGEPTFVVDDNGNVLAGVRTPVVDAPVDVLSGLTDSDSVLCILFGKTTPMTDEALGALYSGPDDYLEQYAAATDAAIEAGFLLDDDRDEILSWADPSRVPG